jgi:hypothetical protein
MLPPSPVVVPYDSPDEGQHFEVLLDAYQMFRDKSMFRGDMWRRFPTKDKIRELRERVTRIETAANLGQMRPDAARREIRADAIDIINYATFLVKQIDEGFDL